MTKKKGVKAFRWRGEIKPEIPPLNTVIYISVPSSWCLYPKPETIVFLLQTIIFIVIYFTTLFRKLSVLEKK